MTPSVVGLRKGFILHDAHSPLYDMIKIPNVSKMDVKARMINNNYIYIYIYMAYRKTKEPKNRDALVSGSLERKNVCRSLLYIM